MSINRVTISGNLTRDPELRNTSGGLPILALSVAVNDRRKKAGGDEWEDYPNYVDCILFGTRGESLAKMLKKGTKVAISGKLRYSSWEKDGVKRSKLEVVAEDIEFFAPKPAQAQQTVDDYVPFE